MIRIDAVPPDILVFDDESNMGVASQKSTFIFICLIYVISTDITVYTALPSQIPIKSI